jgi:hypothetical protein
MSKNFSNSYSDWNITTSDGEVFFNFCRNTKKSCPDTEAKPTVILGIDTEATCHRMAGNDTQMNQFSLKSIKKYLT